MGRSVKQSLTYTTYSRSKESVEGTVLTDLATYAYSELDVVFSFTVCRRMVTKVLKQTVHTLLHVHNVETA